MLAGCAILSACSQAPKLELQSISGVMPDLQFQLTDENGRAVTAQDYRGYVVLLYFGYTHCPDVCPTTLAFLSQAIKGLGTNAGKVRVLFVTVDPRRDTGALLKRYASYFGPQFSGLRGDATQLIPLTRRYHASFQLDAPDQYGNYAVQHSSAVYIFDPRGRARLVTDATDQARLLTHDLRALIGGA
jgi:protein SCO1